MVRKRGGRAGRKGRNQVLRQCERWLSPLHGLALETVLAEARAECRRHEDDTGHWSHKLRGVALANADLFASAPVLTSADLGFACPTPPTHVGEGAEVPANVRFVRIHGTTDPEVLLRGSIRTLPARAAGRAKRERAADRAFAVASDAWRCCNAVLDVGAKCPACGAGRRKPTSTATVRPSAYVSHTREVVSKLHTKSHRLRGVGGKAAPYDK